jgi:biotin synthase
MKALIDKLRDTHALSRDEWMEIFAHHSPDDEEYARQAAREICDGVYGRAVFLRGLIEVSSYCKNDCNYCGLRRSNALCERYRISPEDIMECCRAGYELGLRTFVLQGGEDMWFTDERLEAIVKSIRREFPDCAITISLGERSRESYQRLFDAGANRYLLRHETADAAHYSLLHPAGMSMENRMECLRNLKAIGYQVGAGIMVGSPGQSAETLASDMLFMAELAPHMVGVGPFLPHHATPFRDRTPGSVANTLFILSLIRIMLPQVLLPATTALATLDTDGRTMGLRCGANVIMPNLSPADVRSKYLLYDGKRATGNEAAESIRLIRRELEAEGFEAVISRGDHIAFSRKTADKGE